MVAAWISADTGVGPAMAAGSHHHSGPCADLAQAAITKHQASAVARSGACWAMAPSPVSSPMPAGTNTTATSSAASPMALAPSAR